MFKVYEIKQRVFESNEKLADQLRADLKREKTFLLNLMSSPGAGKTTTLKRTIESLKDELSIGVMEADIDSRHDGDDRQQPRRREAVPIVGYAMEAYGRVRGPMSSGSFPVGVGLMRVIPIQSAIDGETRKASYEEISSYLEENDIFTVSPCSCRTDREVMGEGCEYLKNHKKCPACGAWECVMVTGQEFNIKEIAVFEGEEFSEDESEEE